MAKIINSFFITIFVLFITACNQTRPTPTDWQEQMAYQRGIEAVNWGIPAVSMISMREGNFSLGGGYNTIYYMSKPPTPLAEAITPNNQTPYATVFLNTRNGPVVLEIPPATKKPLFLVVPPMFGRCRL